MIIADFLENSKGFLKGFRISGHADGGEYGKDIICAAVSAMSYMTANTITEVIGCKAEIKVKDGDMSLLLTDGDEEKCEAILKGFYLQMSELQHEYSDNIKIQRGVNNA